VSPPSPLAAADKELMVVLDELIAKMRVSEMTIRTCDDAIERLRQVEVKLTPEQQQRCKSKQNMSIQERILELLAKKARKQEQLLSLKKWKQALAANLPMRYRILNYWAGTASTSGLRSHSSISDEEFHQLTMTGGLAGPDLAGATA
jgi:hypothetical protein